MLEQDLETADSQDLLALQAQLTAANNLSDAAIELFEPRFLNRDGSYALQRQIGEMWADVAREKEMDFAPQYQEAERMRSKTRWLLFAVMILSIAPVFYALVESTSQRMKGVLIVAGSLFAIAGVVLALLVEFNLV